MSRRSTLSSQPSREQSDRLNDAADTLASLLQVDPEQIGTEPTRSRLSLTLDQAVALLRLLYPNGQRALREMANTCHWVEHCEDGDYQCDARPGHFGTEEWAAERAHHCTIRLTETLPGSIRP